MDHNMQIFENAHFGKIRTIEKDGEVWFVGKDVSSALGYSNPQKASRTVPICFSSFLSYLRT